jgi:serine/threonine protein kinase
VTTSEKRYCDVSDDKIENLYARIASPPPDLVGQKVDNRYQVLRLLGEGGMGIVYEAEQDLIGRRVALKVLKREVIKNEESVRRFLTEARAIASLRSMNTVTLFDFGVTSEGLLYYTMEPLDGRNLADVIDEKGAFPPEEAVDIMAQCCDSLEEAHKLQILHRDIKPENIFLNDTPDGEKALVKVLDFGIAKLVGDETIESVTRTGMICGTPAYMAPERVLGNEAVPASDLYALGIVLYELLCGKPPFMADTAMKVMLKHLNEKPEPVATHNPEIRVPEAIEAFLQWVLAKEPEARPQSAPEFRKELYSALEAHHQAPRSVPLPSMARSPDGTRELEKVNRRLEQTTDEGLQQPKDTNQSRNTQIASTLAFDDMESKDTMETSAERPSKPLGLIAALSVIVMLVGVVVWLLSSGTPSAPSSIDGQSPTRSVPVSHPSNKVLEPAEKKAGSTSFQAQDKPSTTMGKGSEQGIATDEANKAEASAMDSDQPGAKAPDAKVKESADDPSAKAKANSEAEQEKPSSKKPRASKKKKKRAGSSSKTSERAGKKTKTPAATKPGRVFHKLPTLTPTK